MILKTVKLLKNLINVGILGFQNPINVLVCSQSDGQQKMFNPLIFCLETCATKMWPFKICIFGKSN